MEDCIIVGGVAIIIDAHHSWFLNFDKIRFRDLRLGHGQVELTILGHEPVVLAAPQRLALVEIKAILVRNELRLHVHVHLHRLHEQIDVVVISNCCVGLHLVSVFVLLVNLSWKINSDLATPFVYFF